MTTETTTADGQTQTKLRSRGQVAYQDPADQLFYLTGENSLLAVPAEDMHDLLEEMRLLETVVEAQEQALEFLHKSKDDLMQAYKASADPNAIKKQEQLVKQAQKKVDKANEKLREEVKPLTPFSDNTNHITELIPIRKPGGGKAVSGFKMTYIRSQKMKNHWKKYQLKSKADTTGGDNSVIKDGKIDTKKLREQLTNVKGNTSFKFSWFDDWLKHSDGGELLEWATAVNDDLKYKGELAQVGDKDSVLSAKVDLGAEAQLMRWTAGSSGLSGEFNPFNKKAAIKANGYAELMLAEAKSSIDCYVPSGGYMMVYGGVDLGMLRAHMSIEATAGVGGSLAVELNIDADFSDKGSTVKGTQGRTAAAGLPGRSKIEMKGPDEHSEGAGLSAFVGAEVAGKVSGQLEWKNPEENKKYSPFATVSQSGAIRVGAGAEAGLKVYYEYGKFRFMAKASLCWGVGAKGKVQLEVDAGLIYEFLKVVAYQLKNVDYKKLEFIEDEAFKALSNMIVLALQTGEAINNFMYNAGVAVEQKLKNFWEAVESEKEASDKRGDLVERINNNPDILKYSTPDAKGFILYRLIQINSFDLVEGKNRTWDYEDINFWRFGFMTERKRAIINIFSWVQSKEDFDNVMQRVKPNISDINISSNEGKKMVLDFLSKGERVFLSSNYGNNLKRFYGSLKDRASKGSKIVKNDMADYLTQNDIDNDFYTPCFNNTECIKSEYVV